MLNKNKDLIISISAAYNESKYLHNLIIELKSTCFKVIIIDDGSSDNTCEVIRKENVDVITNVEKLGKGASIIEGYQYLIDNKIDFDYVVLIDSDLQHDPKEIKDLLTGLKINRAGMIIGKRDFTSSKMPLVRKIWNYTSSLIHRKIFNISIFDSQSGYRIFTKKAFLDIFKEIKEKGYLIETEINFIAKRLNIKTVEHPIKTIYQNEKLENDKTLLLLIRMLMISKYIFVAALAVIINKYKTRIIYALLFISICSYSYNLYIDSGPIFNADKQITYARDYVSATNWLKKNTKINSIILTEWTEGHQVVLLSDRKVVATSKVYPTEADEISGRYIDLATFFYSNDERRIRNILDKHNVSYVFIRKEFDYNSSCKGIGYCNRNNSFLQAMLLGKTDSYGLLRKKFENNSIVIYEH